MSKCYFCKKQPSFGNKVSHSKRRTKRTFKSNLHKTRIKGKRFLICSSCRKKMNYFSLA